MQAVDIKKAAHQLIDQLPDDANWDQLAYEVEVRASIERGLADANAGHLIPVNELLKEFGIAE